MSGVELISVRGRPTKFTPERLDQIRNLVERGRSREEIAEILEVTVNSLAATCSRLGVPLRRHPDKTMGARRPAPATSLEAKRPEPKPHEGAAMHVNGNDAISDPPPAPKPRSEPVPRIVLQMRYRGKMRETDLNLETAEIVGLILDADLQGLRLADYLAKMLAEGLGGNACGGTYPEAKTE